MTHWLRPFIQFVALPAVAGGVIGLGLLMAFKPRDSSQSYADAVQRAAPAVVNIYSSKRLPVSQHPICQMPRFREMCDALYGGRGNVQSSLGSGVVVHSGGYVLTNHHVIRDADEILVQFIDGRQSAGKMIGSDPETDLAIIKVEAENLIPIRIADPVGPRVGDVVLAIGNPFGIGQTVTLGIVSATGRYGFNNSPYSDFIQTDAAVHPGNSGGALIDTSGDLVGINSLIFSESGASEGIGFAIPAPLAFNVMEQIIEQGQVRRGWLGIELESAPPEGLVTGLEVRLVFQGSPAAEAGVVRGDRILSVNERPATSSRTVIRQLAMTEPGSTVELHIERDGETLLRRVTAGLRPRIGG